MTDYKGNELNIGDEVVYVYGKNSYAGLETGKITKFYKNHFGEDECSVDGNTHIFKSQNYEIKIDRKGQVNYEFRKRIIFT